MIKGSVSQLLEVLRKYEQDLLTTWIDEQLQAVTCRRDLLTDRELREQSRQFLRAFCEAVQHHQFNDITGPAWTEICALLADLSQTRAEQGFSSVETATFVFSLKQPLFTCLRKALGNDLEALANDIWTTTLLDKLGLYTTEIYQQSREEIIRRQQQELIELSTPVVKLWDGTVAVPLIGTLDSARTQVVMENLLQSIVAIGASIAIIDITGVPRYSLPGL